MTPIIAVDWPTIASLATAAGTLVLAVATFSSVRSGQRSTRIAERSTAIAERALLLGLRPVLAPARATDPPETVRFGEGRTVTVEGGMAAVEREDDNYYLRCRLPGRTGRVSGDGARRDRRAGGS